MNTSLKATVRPNDDPSRDKKHAFELVFDSLVIGYSALRCDAQLYANKINQAIAEAYNAGITEGEIRGHNEGYEEGSDLGYRNGFEDGILDEAARREDGE